MAIAHPYTYTSVQSYTISCWVIRHRTNTQDKRKCIPSMEYLQDGVFSDLVCKSNDAVNYLIIGWISYESNCTSSTAHSHLNKDMNIGNKRYFWDSFHPIRDIWLQLQKIHILAGIPYWETFSLEGLLSWVFVLCLITVNKKWNVKYLLCNFNDKLCKYIDVQLAISLRLFFHFQELITTTLLVALQFEFSL